ncbi:LPS assembly lipoprotein LptE [Hyphomonas sp.]|jgi:LPS-assembly lipoprotein|uniref:LPS assembly lipoprotein LptE n=1 Tax=Hyphomonas sp. TaxID=87 RepID=UPI0004221F34|nr:LPS assembly lipoprotein LptE [Hyphomonas sp.]MEE2921474.1 LPS assembly lipoprotein LptE [Pseudomonadota bacterium]
MRHILAIAALTLMAACGFQPVYSSGATAASAGNITVAKIDGRAGYEMRRALLEELAIGLPNVTGPATLEVTLKEKLSRLTFETDGTARRSSVSATGRYVLIYGDQSISGRQDAELSFAVPDNPYGDVANQTGASNRVARLLAKKIVDDLRLQLSAG